MNTKRAIVWVLCGGSLMACGGAQRNDAAYDRLQRMSSGAVAREVQRDAPEAYAEFARAAQSARAAQGDSVGAEAERAELVLSWAQTQAQVARARVRTAQAERQRAEIEQDVERLRQQAAEHERAAASVRTAREGASSSAQGANASADPATRATTAAEMRQQAGLVLAAAELLGADEAARARARASLDQAEQLASSMVGTPAAAPLPRPGPRPARPRPAVADVNAVLAASGRALLAADAVLTAARSARTQTPRVDGAQIVSDISQAGGFEPRRDGRGVVLTMRGLFDRAGAVSAAGRGRLTVAARILGQHGAIPVRVEAFASGPDRARAEARALTQARAVVDALVHDGVPAARLTPAGLARVPAGARIDDAVELVLVLPNEP